MANIRQKSQSFFLLVGTIIGWTAIILQFYLMLRNSLTTIPEIIIRFFSFFTILTNILVTLCFTILYRNNKTKLHQFISRGKSLTAVAVYIFIVGLVYQIILRSTWTPEGLQLIVDELLHTFIPLYFIFYWVLFVPKNHLQWNDIPYWLIYPGLYLLYILSRGALSGFYPYPFMSVTNLGYETVFINSGILLGLFIAFSACFIGIGKLIRRNEARETYYSRE